MQTFLLVLHIVLSFVIVVVILLQSGKGGGMGAGFGGAAAAGQEIFGGRGAATFLGKLTVVLGATFMTTSIALAWFSSKPQSVLDLTQGGAAGASQAQVHQIVEEGSGPMPGAQEQIIDPSVDFGDLEAPGEPGQPTEIPPEILEQLQRQLDEIDEGEGPVELPEFPVDEVPAGQDAAPAPPVPLPPSETQPEVEVDEEAAPQPAPEPAVAPEPTPRLEPEADREPEPEVAPEPEAPEPAPEESGDEAEE